MLDSQRTAREIHDRLHNPPNAVVDHGIDLKRPKKPRIVIPINVDPPAPPPAIVQASVDKAELADMEQRVAQLQVKLALMRGMATEREQWHPQVRDIQDAVCSKDWPGFDISRRDLLSPRRTAKFVLPRHVALYLARTMTLRSYPEIGRLFGGMDHSSAIHAFRNIEQRRTADAALNEQIVALERMFAR